MTLQIHNNHEEQTGKVQFSLCEHTQRWNIIELQNSKLILSVIFIK